MCHRFHRGRPLRPRRRASRGLAACASAGLAVLVCAAPGHAIDAAGCPGASAIPTGATLQQASGATRCLVNQVRGEHGRAPLASHPRLALAAGRHGLDMVRRRYLGHRTPTGVTLVRRLERVGYVGAGRTWTAGEDLAWGTGVLATPERTVQAWLDSPSHRRVLLDAGYREIGIGVVLGLPVDRADLRGQPAVTYAADFGSRTQ